MKTKLITTIMIALFLASIASSVTALPTGSAHWSNKEFYEGKFSVQLIVEDGNSRIVAVVIPVDVALDDISTLEFWKMVVDGYCGWNPGTFPCGWNPSILLGIDLDGDDKYRAEDFKWQFSADLGYVPQLLLGDTFIQGESGKGLAAYDTDWTLVDAYNNYAWFTPNPSGVGYYPYYGSLSGFQTASLAGIPTNAKVKVVKILIGGSSSWMEEVAFVDWLVLNGDTILDEPNNSKARFEVVTKE